MEKNSEGKSKSLFLIGLEYFFALLMFGALILMVAATYNAVK